MKIAVPLRHCQPTAWIATDCNADACAIDPNQNSINILKLTEQYQIRFVVNHLKIRCIVSCLLVLFSWILRGPDPSFISFLLSLLSSSAVITACAVVGIHNNHVFLMHFSFQTHDKRDRLKSKLLLVGEPELNIWLCVCGVCVVSVCVCGVPWMDAMLQSVREER